MAGARADNAAMTPDTRHHRTDCQSADDHEERQQQQHDIQRQTGLRSARDLENDRPPLAPAPGQLLRPL